ncbi:hypothetical protein, partial [Microcystis sp. LE19-59.1C]|uniref:hypothetical protein n=1 Tax=Microcystis sp. LE19-59.1C TaxID=3016442 RepID=UPI0022C0B52F
WIFPVKFTAVNTTWVWVKMVSLGAGWGVGGLGCGVWGFTYFQVVSYLIFREKVQGFSPRSPQRLVLFEGKKV